MRFARGNGYDLMVFEDEDVDMWIGRGLVLRMDGDIAPTHGSGKQLPGSAWEVSTTAYLKGHGTVAIAQTLDPVDILNAGYIKPQQPRVTEKPWGFEIDVPSSSQMLLLKYLVVNHGHSTSKQYHEHKDESILFLEGGPVGETPWHISPGTVHRVSGFARYFEASTYFPDDVIRLDDRYGRTKDTEEVTTP